MFARLFFCGLLFVVALVMGLSPKADAKPPEAILADVERANTAENCWYLSDAEKEVVMLINLARINGQLFSKLYLRAYVHDTTLPDYQSLILRLKTQASLAPLLPERALSKSAELHATVNGREGETSINPISGQPFYDQMHMFYPGAKIYARNAYAGSTEPLEIVARMLLETEEYEKGHRENILSPNLELLGISIKPHKTHCHLAVVDFATVANQPILTGNTDQFTTYRKTEKCPVKLKKPKSFKKASRAMSK